MQVSGGRDDSHRRQRRLCPGSALHPYPCSAHRNIIMVKGRNAFSCARSSVAFVYPSPWVGMAGALRMLPKNISNVLQNICHPHREACKSSPQRPGKENIERSAEKDFLSPVSCNSNSRDQRFLSSRLRSQLSACLYPILLCVLLSVLIANLNETLNITSPRTQDSSGHGGT